MRLLLILTIAFDTLDVSFESFEDFCGGFLALLEKKDLSELQYRLFWLNGTIMTTQIILYCLVRPDPLVIHLLISHHGGDKSFKELRCSF